MRYSQTTSFSYAATGNGFPRSESASASTRMGRFKTDEHVVLKRYAKPTIALGSFSSLRSREEHNKMKDHYRPTDQPTNRPTTIITNASFSSFPCSSTAASAFSSISSLNHCHRHKLQRRCCFRLALPKVSNFLTRIMTSVPNHTCSEPHWKYPSCGSAIQQRPTQQGAQ